jgi:hypothetical protein
MVEHRTLNPLVASSSLALPIPSDLPIAGSLSFQSLLAFCSMGARTINALSYQIVPDRKYRWDFVHRPSKVAITSGRLRQRD